MIGRKTLKVVACNTVLVPPFPEKCAELTLTITSTGITIVTTTKATETTPATGRFTWRPMRFNTKVNFPDFITTTASTAPPFIGKPSTTDVLDGGDRTVLIIVGTIIACVAVSGVTTIVVLFVRVRRLTATVNAMTATGTKTGTY
ncbi:hypothetical protein LSAT2_015901 [Lamellibrachia satsuma]|nr:hypothetical protein LSAT2_015901 [Lamellibrachia satsuma]